jgi:hypothetical protein
MREQQNRRHHHLICCHSIAGITVEVETSYRCLGGVFAGYLDVFCGVLAAISRTLFAESQHLKPVSCKRVNCCRGSHLAISLEPRTSHNVLLEQFPLA